MANPILHAISLCAGVGMLDVGVRAAFGYLGIDLRTIAYGEWEAPAASQLVALMEAGALEPAPVFCGDFRRIGAGRFRGAVDGIVAGFPCQDMSIAGRRAGLDGTRSGLFFDILDTADACSAWWLSLENVSGIATATASVMDEEEGALDERAAARVVGELADRGWDSEWVTLSASDVGASHGRARWFCFAWRRELADAGRSDARRGEQERIRRCLSTAEHLPEGAAMVDASGHDGRGSHGEAGLGRRVCEAGDSMAHTECAERRSERAGSAGSLQGHDERRGEADGGPWVAGEVLGDTAHDHGRRGVCPAQTGTGPCRCGRRGLAGPGGPMADTSDTRLQGCEQRGACACHGGAGSTWTS